MFAEIVLLFRYAIISIIAVIFAYLLLLYTSERFRKFSFAIIFKTVAAYWGPRFQPHRKAFLRRFTELKPKNTNEKLAVLEIGPGAGSNFDFYPDNCQLTALDYNAEFKKTFMENVSKRSNIEFLKYINGDIQDMAQIESESMDVVITTHVLCSVKDHGRAFREIKRVLKKGGKYFFMEHVAYKTTHSTSDVVWSWIQIILQPLWTLVMGGCIPQRKTWIGLEGADFDSLEINVAYPDNIPQMIRPQMWGLAQK